MADRPQPQPQSLYTAATDAQGPPSAEIFQALSSIQHQPADLGLQSGIRLSQPASNPAGEVQDPHFATGQGQSGTSEATLTTTNGSTSAGPNPMTYLAPSAVMSEYDALFARLKEKPHDPEGWRRLVDHAESSGEIDKIRAAYDALLKQYPNTVCFWSLICASLSLPSTPHHFSTHLFYLFTCNGEHDQY